LSGNTSQGFFSLPEMPPLPSLDQARLFLYRALGTAAVYYLVAYLGIYLGTLANGAVSSIWPAAGVAAAASIRYRMAGQLGVFIGAIGANLNIVPDQALLYVAFGVAAGAWLVAWIPRKIGSSDLMLETIGDIARFGLLGLPIGAAVNALIETIALMNFGGIDSGSFLRSFWQLWTADWVGAMLIAPVLLTANSRSWISSAKAPWLEWVGAAIASVLVGIIILGSDDRNSIHTGDFLLFPLVLWVALRFPIGATSMLILFAGAVRIIAEMMQYGPLGPRIQLSDIMSLQVTLVSLSLGGLLVSSALSERRQSEIRLDMLANHDPLTGLPNRSYFQDYLQHAIAQCRRQGGQVSLLFIDLDRFKHINDSRGHEVGDQVLRIVASRLIDTLRTDDFVGRLGGDEFAVVISHPKSHRGASRVATKLIESLSQSFKVEDVRYAISASIGISVCPDDGTDANTLLRQADLAMYQAKQRKSGFEYFSDEMNAAAHEQLLIESGLRQALQKNDFALLYQPKVDLETGRVVGLEALIRWMAPGGKGVVGPDKFIPIAEDTGLIIPIGRWALRKACQQWVSWHQAGLNPPSVSVNLSPRQFSQGGLAQDVLSAIEETGMDASFLGLEITESAAMDNPELTTEVLMELGGRGIKIMIDDFGTGHSNLRQLKRLPIDTLKIDKGFVRDVLVDREDAEIAHAIIRLAHTLDMRVVAEGVESQEVAAFLKERKCDEIQGYLVSKPLIPEAVPSLFNKTFKIGLS
jgi:diguanylate cyclase (GGDEF)-like protein